MWTLLLNQACQERTCGTYRMEIPSLIAIVAGVVLFFYCVRLLINLSLSFALLLLLLTVSGALSFILLPSVRSILSSLRGG